MKPDTQMKLANECPNRDGRKSPLYEKCYECTYPQSPVSKSILKELNETAEQER